jgi:hypothetical protein
VRVPDRAPTTLGVNVTPTLHVSPAPTLEPQVLLATAKSPVMTTGEIARDVLRWFVSVTVWAELVVPTVRLENVRLEEETVTGKEPVPVRLTVCGLFVALSLNVSVPAREPVVAGENVTPIVQVVPAAILAPQVLVAMEKSPLAEILENASGVFLRFVSMTDLAVLTFPTATVPKFKLEVESVT